MSACPTPVLVMSCTAFVSIHQWWARSDILSTSRGGVVMAILLACGDGQSLSVGSESALFVHREQERLHSWSRVGC